MSWLYIYLLDPQQHSSERGINDIQWLKMTQASWLRLTKHFSKSCIASAEILVTSPSPSKSICPNISCGGPNVLLEFTMSASCTHCLRYRLPGMSLHVSSFLEITAEWIRYDKIISDSDRTSALPFMSPWSPIGTASISSLDRTPFPSCRAKRFDRMVTTMVTTMVLVHGHHHHVGHGITCSQEIWQPPMTIHYPNIH